MLADACNPASVPEYLNVVYDSSSPEVRAGGRSRGGMTAVAWRWGRRGGAGSDGRSSLRLQVSTREGEAGEGEC